MRALPESLRSRRTVRVSGTGPVQSGAVWSCLADPHTFAVWVSGTDAVRAASGDWPAVGAVLYHRWGPWPVRVRDRTTVTGCRPPVRLDLCARVRPIATVAVQIELAVVPEGTHVVLTETIEHGLAVTIPPLTRAIQTWRNRRSLDALLRLAAARSDPGTNR